MDPSNGGIYPSYCISLLIYLSPPPDCELPQGKSYPWSFFFSWHCPVLAGVQEVAVRVKTGSVPPSGTFPFSYPQAVEEENDGTMCPCRCM